MLRNVRTWGPLSISKKYCTRVGYMASRHKHKKLDDSPPAKRQRMLMEQAPPQAAILLNRILPNGPVLLAALPELQLNSVAVAHQRCVAYS